MCSRACVVSLKSVLIKREESCLREKRQLTQSTTDAIHGASVANTSLLPFGPQDSLTSDIIDPTARILVPTTPCRGRSGYCPVVYQHDPKVALRHQPSCTCHGPQDHVWRSYPSHQPNRLARNQEGYCRYESDSSQGRCFRLRQVRQAGPLNSTSGYRLSVYTPWR